MKYLLTTTLLSLAIFAQPAHAFMDDLKKVTETVEAVSGVETDHYARPELNQADALGTAISTLGKMDSLFKLGDLDTIHELSYLLEEAVKLLPIEPELLQQATSLAKLIHLGSEGEGSTAALGENIDLLSGLLNGITG